MNENIETKVEKLRPFTKILMTIGQLPTSYLMSMSFYEQLIWFTKYLQEQVIPAVNTNASAVEELQGLYLELQNYVDTYFDNLDVQEEINNKIDKMVEDGSLTLLIKNYIDPLYQAYETEINQEIDIINSSVQSQNSSINVLTQRMDGFESLTEGSTTGDAELMDIRTSYTGETYANAGNSVRNQSESIADNTGVHVYNLSTKNANQNYYDYGSVSENDTLIYKIEDYTGTPGIFAIYGKETENSNWATLLSVNTIDAINQLKQYHKYTFSRNYYMIRFFMSYTGTGASENVNVLINNANDNNINNRVFTLEENSNKLDYVISETGINVINLSTKNANQNYYDYGSVSENDTLIYKIEDYTGTPNAFYIYAKVNEDSAWETLVNANTSSLIENLTENYHFLKFSKNYGYIRIFMSYTGTGTSEDVNVLANLLNSENILSKTIKNENEINNLKYEVGNDIYKIFRKVICCGDSYTAGYISVDGTTSQFNENYAWPHFMSTSSGNNYLNCGLTGTTTKTWQSNQYGLAKCQTLGTCQAYICGFGINDSNTLLNVYLPVGDIDDVNYDIDTFYSQYAKLIRALHNISPNAFIFMQTCPDSDTSRYNPYNQAIRDIAELYHDTYHTHVLDLANYKDLYNSISISSDYISGHYTAIGYEQFAEILKRVLSDYIKDNISEFQKVAFITYN